MKTADDINYENKFGFEKRTFSSTHLETVDDSGQASLIFRHEGASILDLTVGGRQILTSPSSSDDFEQPVKIDATHTMLPAGKSNFGPQHGPSRYLDYGINTQLGSSAQLSARDNLRGLGHTKSFELLPNGLQIIDDVANLNNVAEALSVGEHFYFSIEEQDIPEIIILDKIGEPTEITVGTKDGTSQTGTIKDLWPELQKGESFLYDGYSGSQQLRLPGNKVISIDAFAQNMGESVPVQMLIWHRPDTNTVCFEPVAGFTRDENGIRKNDAIILNPHEDLQLISRVTVI